ncbi:MAG TPA: polysaccharide deacetylase family protein [Thermoanaerobaculia bacterium]
MNRYYATSLAFSVIVACYFIAALPWPWWVPAILLLSLITQIPMYILGLLIGDRNNLHAQSMMLSALLLAATIYFAMQSGWVHWIAWSVFVLPAFLAYPTLVPNSQWLGPVITHFETSDNELWLTIDDGPTSDTPALLDLLDARGVKATFFVKGKLATDLRSITDRGHTIGNHSYSHPSGTFWCLGPHAIEREIDRGVPSKLFRAPVGMKNPFVHPALAQRGMKLIGWSARGFDATVSDADRVVARIASRLEPGAIVVVHQGREWSLRCIDRVIDEAQRRGYRFVIPDEARLRAGVR